MIEACGVQECPYCRHSRKSGSSVRLSVALSLRQCVSIFMTHRTVGKVRSQTVSIVYPRFLFAVRFIPLIRDGENCKWKNKKNSSHCSIVTRLHESLLISLKPAWPSRRWNCTIREASWKSGISVPLKTSHFSDCLGFTTEAFINHCQASLSLSSHSQP